MALTKTDRLSGCVASLTNELPEIANKFKLRATHFTEVFGSEKHEKVEDFKLNESLMLNVNTSISVGKVVGIKDNVLDLSLNIPVIAFKGDSVGLARNINGHWRLIGVGEVI